MRTAWFLVDKLKSELFLDKLPNSELQLFVPRLTLPSTPASSVRSASALRMAAAARTVTTEAIE